MTLTNRKIIIGLIIIFTSLIFGYLFFERFLTEKEVTITVINSEKFGDEPGRYLIFTKDEVFEDANNYYHDKHNATAVYNKLEKGRTYVVKVVSFYWPDLPHFRNIIDVVRVKFPEEN
ncbi:MAG: hypothetical protein P8Z35_02460 [Ignavibacteriaceae bacterium]